LTTKRRALFVVLALMCACAPMPEQTHEAIATWKAGTADPDCEVPGESSKWQADYCLAAMHTDDLVAAQVCMEREQRTRHGEECARRRHFKQEWCRVVVDSGALRRSLAECIADPEQGGAVVKGVQLE
jgi:hypothetical protein